VPLIPLVVVVVIALILAVVYGMLLSPPNKLVEKMDGKKGTGRENTR
jgi:hypothetical protein